MKLPYNLSPPEMLYLQNVQSLYVTNEKTWGLGLAQKKWKCEKYTVIGRRRFTSWWLNQPIWKICSSNWIISPSRGENTKIYLKPPPSSTTVESCSIQWAAGAVLQLLFSSALVISRKAPQRHLMTPIATGQIQFNRPILVKTEIGSFPHIPWSKKPGNTKIELWIQG